MLASQMEGRTTSNDLTDHQGAPLVGNLRYCGGDRVLLSQKKLSWFSNIVHNNL